MARKLNGIELTRYDDLFKTDAEREADQQERVQIVPAEQVFPYARQPYSVDRPSADLVRLMDSIERTGIAEPLIVRPRSEGGYEIISGHRRDYCAKVVGLDIAGVDLVCQDISKPLEAQGGAILEVNGGPGLLMHLKPSVGVARPVGQAIVEHLFPSEDGDSEGLAARIPGVGIAGTRHNAFIARLVGWLLQLSGKRTGVASSEGTFP